MKHLFIGLALAGLAGCAEYKGTSGKSDVTVAFIGVDAEATLSTSGASEITAQRIANVNRHCRQTPVRDTGDFRVKAIPDALTGAAAQVFTSEITRAITAAVQARQKRFARTYNASVNVPSFVLGRTSGQIRCVAVKRTVDDAVVSKLVFELVNQGNSALFLRPLFAEVKALQSSTGVGAKQIGLADIVISVGVKSILKDGEIAMHNETFKIGKLQSEVSVQGSSQAIPKHKERSAKSWASVPTGTGQGQYDSAYLPYFPGRPTTLGIAVTEVGAGASSAGTNSRIVADNKASLESVIRAVIDAGLGD